MERTRGDAVTELNPTMAPGRIEAPAWSRIDQAELGLRDLLRLLTRRRRVIVLITLAVLAAGLGLSFLQDRVYEGKAQVLLQPRSTESLFDANVARPPDPDRTVKTEIEVLKSRPIRAGVRRQLGVAPRPSVSSVNQTDLIEVRVRHRDPKLAARIADAYAQVYIDFRRTQAVDDQLAAGARIYSKVDELQKEIDALDAQIASLPAAERQALGSSLTDRKAGLFQNLTLFQNRLDELQVNAELKTGGAQLVSLAAVPESPVRPRPAHDMVLAAIIGLFLGLGVAFLVDYLDESIKTRDDLERAIGGGTVVIGSVPGTGSRKSQEGADLVSLTEPSSPAAEAYRKLRTSLQFRTLAQPLRTLQITSPSASEGKTTTVANLGVAFARAGVRVVVVCCDLRRPRLHELFGLENNVGFTSVLLGEAELSSALQPVPGIDRLRLLASGPMPPNPSEVLMTSRAASVLNDLATQADLVLIDSAPILPVADPLILAGRVDGTVLVVAAESTGRKAVGHAIEMLRQVDVSILGVVLNRVKEDSSSSYAYRHMYETRTSDGAGGDSSASNGSNDKAKIKSGRRR